MPANAMANRRPPSKCRPRVLRTATRPVAACDTLLVSALAEFISPCKNRVNPSIVGRAPAIGIRTAIPLLAMCARAFLQVTPHDAAPERGYAAHGGPHSD